MIIQTIMKTPWDSIDEMNTVDNVAMVHRNFAGLFMSCMAFGKFLLPFKKYAMSIPTSKELNSSIETSMKMESFATYIKIEEFNAKTGICEEIPVWNKLEVPSLE